MCILCDIEVENDGPSCSTCGETELTEMGNCPNGCDDERYRRTETLMDRWAVGRLAPAESEIMNLADAQDIAIAREAAEDAERDELPTRAACIRACASSAEVASELLDGCNALLGLLQLIEGRCDAELLEIIRTNHRVEEARAAVAKVIGR